MMEVTNINDLLEGHVALEVEALDRIYLHGYFPNLMVGGQVVRFLEHLGNVVPSPGSFLKIGNRFRKDVHAFAATHEIPLLRLKRPNRSRWDDRKLDHVRLYLEAAERDARFGVVFIKVCTYFPYRIKVWLSGHARAKHQADREGVAHRSLANGFASCEDPQALQAICGHTAQIMGTYDRTSRSGLCHRLCALRAHPPALRMGGPTNRSPALRGSERYGPDRRAVRVCPRLRRGTNKSLRGWWPDCSASKTAPAR
jgi:hypothetical protein